MKGKSKDRLKEKVKSIPRKPGIYFFKNAEGIPIYIGKAHSLHDRVKSYFSTSADRKIASILAETQDIDFIIADSEREASFLENNFIRQLQPKFNLRLKDDKHFPFLKVTVQDDFPGIYLTRRVEKDGSGYFGPFSPAHQARKTIHLISKYFGIRTCREVIPGKRTRPCLDYDLGLCTAPCVRKITKKEYREHVQDALLFLEGREKPLTSKLKSRMQAAAAALDYEGAAHWRDLIQTIDQIKTKPQFISIQQDNKDIFGFAGRENQAGIVFFLMRDGKVEDSHHIILPLNQDRSRFLGQYLSNFYSIRTDLPDRILIPFQPEGMDTLIQNLSTRRGKKIEALIPRKGKNKKLIEFASRNADILLRTFTEEPSPLLELQTLLRLKNLPNRIEGYDISNTGGESSAGSVVVFEQGMPQKKDYRIYRIKSVKGANDVASLQEVLKRHHKKTAQIRGEFPDLILLDGGKGQLNAALKIMKSLNLEHIPMAALAKKEEILFVPWNRAGFRLDKTSPSLKLLQNIRNEAHRFAIAYHRKKREQKSFSSLLDGIPGIGPKRKAVLLEHFKSINAIKNASLENLANFVGKKAALELLSHLKKNRKFL